MTCLFDTYNNVLDDTYDVLDTPAAESNYTSSRLGPVMMQL